MRPRRRYSAVVALRHATAMYFVVMVMFDLTGGVRSNQEGCTYEHGGGHGTQFKQLLDTRRGTNALI